MPSKPAAACWRKPLSIDGSDMHVNFRRSVQSREKLVFLLDDYPDFVASLARPGGNITGLSTLAPEISKQLELLKEIVPRISRVAFLGDVTRPGTHNR